MGEIKILVVEDDLNIAKYIETCLHMGSYTCDLCHNGKEAVQMAFDTMYDLILLDVMLPDLSGFEILERIKKREIPVIFLTAMGSVSDKVRGLRDGAEDYIVKPFESMELLARIEVVLRRNHKMEDILQYKNIKINTVSHEAFILDEQIDLTPKEFEVLAFFITHPNVVISREQLLASIWGYEFEGESRTVDTHVQQMRRKMNLKGLLITVPKYGYKLIG